ncbi:SDR family NAD(P)-dependent oxidoreductase [Gorillibacterium sp. sgz5001074]|uniref:SDR family NAD(P)-dependent oxidoreductase n=1 Tax=Gorillibacterium sp. sgz5001074 TaxID=3446695 RepID=UPI003F67091C
MKIDLSGKIALVTGGASGLGLQMSKSLAACGAKVAINYWSGNGDQAVEEIRQAGGEAAAFRADATKPRELERLVKDVEMTFGSSVDILVCNAGGMIKRVPNAEMTEEHYDLVMNVNFKSTVFACQAVLPGMIGKKGGAIVNMASLAAHDGGGPGASVYAASKAAVHSFSKGLAKEVAPHGIRVNVVSPGLIGQTAFHDTHTAPAARQATVGRIPLQREGTPEDVANVVLFLASSLSDYLTGEIVEVNGGLLMR